MKKNKKHKTAVLLAHPRLEPGTVVDWQVPAIKLSRKQRKRIAELGDTNIVTILVDASNGLLTIGTAARDVDERQFATLEDEENA